MTEWFGNWLEPGVSPYRGRRYEFEDAAGGRFTATFDRHEFGDEGVTLYFADRAAFATNMAIRFREVAE